MGIATFTIAELEDAINRARAAQPAKGSEYSLSADVATLGGLYGQLIYRRQQTGAGVELTDAQQAALSRWFRTVDAGPGGKQPPG